LGTADKLVGLRVVVVVVGESPSAGRGAVMTVLRGRGDCRKVRQKNSYSSEKKRGKLRIYDEIPKAAKFKLVIIAMRRCDLIWTAGWSLDPGTDDMTWCNGEPQRSGVKPSQKAALKPGRTRKIRFRMRNSLL
jgi:hypothetical protein